jgi:alpha-tubulin suppressor-like RCC1 family protein
VLPGKVTLTAIGASGQLTASVLDKNGQAVSGRRIVWQSSDATVVSVDSLGLVTAEGAGMATITATAAGQSGQAAAVVSPAASRLVYKAEPSAVVAGSAFDPAVRIEIQDANGHVVSESTAEVTLSLEGGPEGAELLGTSRVKAEGGVVTFEDIRLERAGSGYRLKASAPELVAIESGAFTVQPAEAARLVFVTGVPARVEAQVPFTPAVEVEAEDRFGNRIPDWMGEVTLALEAAVDSAAGLVGTRTARAENGRARFPGLSIAIPGKGQMLRAEAGDLSVAKSAPFYVRLTFDMVSAGIAHTCGVTTAGKAYCWGRNYKGQLGTGDTTNSTIPVAVSDDLAFASVSAGTDHSCGVTTTGRAYCWGAADFGKLGHGRTNDSDVPVEVVSAFSFSMVSATTYHSCGVSTAGKAYCWGNGGGSRLGTGDIFDSAIPSSVASAHTYISLSTARDHSCGVSTTGKAYCWGNGWYGKLGTASTQNSPAPDAVSGTHSFAMVEAGGAHTCGVTTAGKAYCWGHGASGQLGNGGTTDSAVPGAVSGNRTFVTVGAGNSHSCALTTAGEAYCWGVGTFGQLGNNGTTKSAVPVAVSGGLAFSMVSTGGDHSCGITTAGETYCWGNGNEGRLGSGGATTALVPVLVFGTER